MRVSDDFAVLARRTALAVGVAAFLSPAVHAQSTPADAPVTTSADSAQSTPAASSSGNASAAQSDSTLSGTGSSKDATQLDQIVVTGQRAALKKAIDRKKNSDKISDSIVSDDINKLPDNSVTEALQRVPGISIAHFPTSAPGANSDYDHYTAEGGGLLVRGLNQVQSTLNGQETFSANGGRSLSFEDVTPELIAGVDVYKSQSADLIEGGIGGTVDLRTRMPFDFKGANYSLTGKYNYADLANRARPEASALFSDRWKTDSLGEFGALFDVAYSDLVTANNTIGVDNYYAQPTPNTSGETYVPGGVGWRQYTFDRKRVGLYGGFQWKPSSELEAYARYFRSTYDSTAIDQEAYTSFSNSTVPSTSGTAIYNSAGALLYGSKMQLSACSDPFLYSGTTCSDASGSFDPDLITTDTGISKQRSTTTDYTVGFHWNAAERVTVKSELQLVRSDQGIVNQDIYLWNWAPSYSLDLRGDIPQVSFAGTGYNSTDPVQANCSYGGSDFSGCGYGWQATMDHIEHHVGQEAAWHSDLIYDISDTGFIRTLQAGVRLARRTETDDISTYNYNALGADYFRYYQPPAYGGTVQSGYNNYYLSYIAGDHLRVPSSSYTNLVTFNNFFRGKAALPAQVWMPSVSLVEGYPNNVTQLHEQLGAPGDTTGPVTYQPYDLNNIVEHTYSGYFLARFADNHYFGVPMNGNIGVRVVSTGDDINGYEQLPSTTGVILTPGSTAVNFPGGAYARDASTSSTHVLPAANLQFLLTPQTHLRFALSQALNRPSFIQLSPNAVVSAATDANHNFIDFTATDTGNPKLRPETANQFDISLEWYGENDSAAHVSMFYKDIHNYILTGVHTESINIVFPDGSVNPEPVVVTEPFNASKATIEGVEFGGQKYFSSLPGAFRGLGVSANFTYVDAESPDEIAYDMNGNRISGLPLEGLSKYTFNMIGMYDLGPWSARVAYNWRSEWLATTTNNNTSGTVSYGSTTYTYALPVFVRPYGQVDSSLSYKLGQHFTFVVEGSNLFDAMTRTVSGVGDQQHGRNWFLSDRRIGTSVRVSF
jgi:TonB-dependent receptor